MAPPVVLAGASHTTADAGTAAAAVGTWTVPVTQAFGTAAAAGTTAAAGTAAAATATLLSGPLGSIADIEQR